MPRIANMLQKSVHAAKASRVGKIHTRTDGISHKKLLKLTEAVSFSECFLHSYLGITKQPELSGSVPVIRL